MKTLTVAALFGLVTAFSRPSFAQPYPTAPAPKPLAPYTGNTPDAGAVSQAYPDVEPPYDPNLDSDPDIDGYDAEYDVHYDNLAAQGYDDGYDPNAYTQFEGALQPYGNWVDDPSYGRIWAPSESVVGASFFPYASSGHWVLSEYGWTWVSDYDWGWAPFHYGRWVTTASLGWCWVPGSIWGPAWVGWRSGGGYVGWTPLPPRGQPIPAPRPRSNDGWRFTLAHQLGSRQPTYLPRQVVPSVFSHTSVVTNFHSVALGKSTVHVNAGPTNLPGAASAAVHLRQVAPQEMPRLSIVPRAGVALPQRPWVKAAMNNVTVGRPAPLGYRSSASIPIGPQSGVYRAAPGPTTVAPRANISLTPRGYTPHNGGLYVAPPSYARQPGPATFNSPRPQSTYQPPTPRYAQPVYSPPVNQTPRYQAPVQQYQAPVQQYQAPAQRYTQPVYTQPARPSYTQPVYNNPQPAFTPRPSYQAPVVSQPAPQLNTARPAYSHPVAAPSGGRHR